jgi:uncharacterized protein (DUF488 family)
MNIYTIGFTKKTAQEFFELLKENNIKHLLDVRLNNVSQLAGFTKGNDLKYFLKEICECTYTHDIKLAPTKEILDSYKKKSITWNEYEQLFNKLLNERNKNNNILSKYDNFVATCLLCSEVTAENCHRRLVAEFIKSNYKGDDISIIHL